MVAALDRIEQRRAATTPACVRVRAAFAQQLRLGDVSGQQRDQPGGPRPPIPLFERRALCESRLHVGESTQSNSFVELGPPELALVRPRVQEQSDRVEPPEARQHSQAGLPVRADAREIDAVCREQRQQFEHPRVAGDVAPVDRVQQGVVPVIPFVANVRAGLDQGSDPLRVTFAERRAKVGPGRWPQKRTATGIAAVRPSPDPLSAERLRSLAGPAARNVMSRKTVMPARSSATLCSASLLLWFER